MRSQTSAVIHTANFPVFIKVNLLHGGEKRAYCTAAAFQNDQSGEFTLIAVHPVKKPAKC